MHVYNENSNRLFAPHPLHPLLLSLLAVGRVRVGIRDFTVPITDFLRFIKGQGALSLGEI